MFYDNFRRICKSRGTSPSAVALEIGMSKSNVTGWKNGQEPSIGTVLKISKRLNIGIQDLIGGEDGAIDIGLVALNSGISIDEAEKILDDSIDAENPASVKADEVENDEERDLLIRFRAASPEIRAAVLRVVRDDK